MLPSVIPESSCGKPKNHSGIPATHSRTWNPPSAKRNCFDGMRIRDSVEQNFINGMTFTASVDQNMINAMTFPPADQPKSRKTRKPAIARGLSVASGTEGGTRTPTLLRAVDFESTASTIPPLRHGANYSRRSQSAASVHRILAAREYHSPPCGTNIEQPSIGAL